ncbi:MAG: flagellar motor switch protein FliN [Oscillospiraceae bacterium]|nr:flagellar motor switch protein FliN [Oscillospiraceae bacterium]
MQPEKRADLVISELNSLFKFIKECFATTLNLEYNSSVKSVEFGSFTELVPQLNNEEIIGADLFIHLSSIEKFGLFISSKDNIRILMSNIINMPIAKEDFELDVVTKSSIFELFEKIFLNIKIGTENTQNPIDIRAEDLFLISSLQKHARRFNKSEMVKINVNFTITTLLDSEFCLLIPCELFPQLKGKKSTKVSEKKIAEKPSQKENIEDEPISQTKQANKIVQTVTEEKQEETQDLKNIESKEIPKEMAQIEPTKLSTESNEAPEEKIIYKRLGRALDMEDKIENTKEKAVSNLNIPEVYKETLNAVQTPEKKEVRVAEFEQFDDEENAKINNMSNLKLVMSIPIEVSVELGRTRKKIKEVLEYGKGTIIQLDRQAGAQVDIIINGQKIAKGDVVVVDENFGVRITEIAKPKDILDIF